MRNVRIFAAMFHGHRDLFAIYFDVLRLDDRGLFYVEYISARDRLSIGALFFKPYRIYCFSEAIKFLIPLYIPEPTSEKQASEITKDGGIPPSG